MECTSCGKKAVFKGNGQNLCKAHFLEYVEKKVETTIRKYDMLQKDDLVCVATSGGKDSLTVLYLTMKFCRKHKITFFALAIDEGIAGYRDHTLDDLRLFCEKNKVKLHVVSFKKEFGATLDSVKEKAINELNKKPCTVCGIFRRALLNRASRELKATKVVTGHNLDDEVQSLMMNLMKGNMRHNASLGPITGLQQNEKFVTRVKPLYFIMEKETRLYALLKGFKVNFAECPNINLSFRAHVRDEINAIEAKAPGSKQGMVNAFMEILPELKQKYRNAKEFTYCTRCGDACSGEICNTCTMEEKLCLTKK